MKRNDHILIALIYTLMHGGILLFPSGVFWDDWLLFRSKPEVIFETFRQAGAMLNWVSYLHVGLSQFGMGVYRILTFFLMYATGLILCRICEQSKVISSDSVFSLVLLFCILPFNIARVAAIDFAYTICYFVFFLAWQLMSQQRAVAALLFFFSFNTNSLLVFFLLPYLDLMSKSVPQWNFKTMFSFALRNWYFTILPILFFALKNVFYQPTGLYAGYNQHFSWSNLMAAINDQSEDLLNLRPNHYLFFILLPLMFILLRRRKRTNETRTRPVLFVGLASFALGSFPYWILGLVPTFSEWSSRHQLLLPLGVATCLTAVISTAPRRVETLLLAALTALSLSIGIPQYYSFVVDAEKQRQLIQLISLDPKIRDAGLVVFNDRSIHLNAIGRRYRFYEWNGILEAAFNDQKRFGVERMDLEKYRNGSLDIYFSDLYKAGSFKSKDRPVALIDIFSNSTSFDFFGQSLFGTNDKDLVSINVSSEQLLSQ